MICASGNHLLKVMCEALDGLCEAEISHVLDDMNEKEWKKLVEIHEEIFECLRQKEIVRGIEALQKHYDQIDQCYLRRNDKRKER